MARNSSYTRKFMMGPNIIVGCWVLSMFVIFPLFYHDHYFDILQAKYAAACTLTGIMLVSLLIWGIAANHIVDFLKQIHEKGAGAWFKDTFSLLDICVLVFGIVCIISTALSPLHVTALLGKDVLPVDVLVAAIFGNEGRYSGLILMLLYVIMYFCLTRHWMFGKAYFVVFLAVGLLVCLFGITDYFNMDLLGFKSRLNDEQWNTFTSTIGNINTYTTYVALVIAVSGSLFINTPLHGEKKDGESLGSLIFYFICLFVGFLALTMGNSDNGYLTLAAFFGLMPFVAFRSWEGVRRFVLTVAIYFLSIWLMKQINTAYAGSVVGISGLYNVISGFKFLGAVVLALLVLSALLYGLAYAGKKQNKQPGEESLRILRRVWLGILLLGLLGVVMLARIIHGDLSAAAQRFGSLTSYFVFNDAWGTYRGYIWRATWEEYMHLPFLKMLFGSGPDTFGIYMEKIRYRDMVLATGQYFDASHNEYLQYLFTLGPIAMAAYVVLIVRTGFLGLATDSSQLEERCLPHLYGAAFGIICYGAQALVNLNLPLTAPYLWVFLGMAGAMLRSRRQVSKEDKRNAKERT